MFDWKVIATVLILLAIVLSLVGSSPTVSGFFSRVQERLDTIVGGDFGLGRSVERNVVFELTVDSYGAVEFAEKGPLNMTVAGDVSANLPEGNIMSDTPVIITGFSGRGSVGGEAVFNGTFTKLELPEITASFSNSRVDLRSDFRSLEISDLGLDEFSAESDGTLTVAGTETRFSGLVSVEDPVGSFEFSGSDKTSLTIRGRASSISIPSAGISIS